MNSREERGKRREEKCGNASLAAGGWECQPRRRRVGMPASPQAGENVRMPASPQAGGNVGMWECQPRRRRVRM